MDLGNAADTYVMCSEAKNDRERMLVRQAFIAGIVQYCAERGAYFLEHPPLYVRDPVADRMKEIKLWEIIRDVVNDNVPCGCCEGCL